MNIRDEVANDLAANPAPPHYLVQQGLTPMLAQLFAEAHASVGAWWPPQYRDSLAAQTHEKPSPPDYLQITREVAA